MFDWALNSLMTEVPIVKKPVQMIFKANQWTVFYMIWIFVMKELIRFWIQLTINYFDKKLRQRRSIRF